MKRLLSPALQFFCDWLVYLIAIPIMATFAILAISGSHDFVFPVGLSVFGALVALSGLAYAHATSVKDYRSEEAAESTILASKIALGGILLIVSLGIKFAEVVFSWWWKPKSSLPGLRRLFLSVPALPTLWQQSYFLLLFGLAVQRFKISAKF